MRRFWLLAAWVVALTGLLGDQPVAGKSFAQTSQLFPTTPLNSDSCGYKWALWADAQKALNWWAQYNQLLAPYNASPPAYGTKLPAQVASQLQQISDASWALDSQVQRFFPLQMDLRYSDPNGLETPSLEVSSVLEDVGLVAETMALSYSDVSALTTGDSSPSAEEPAIWRDLGRIACTPKHRLFTWSWVVPAHMVYGTRPTLIAKTQAGAHCVAKITYSTGRSPVSFHGTTQIAGSARTVQWTWHEETVGTKGEADVLCQLGSQLGEAISLFTVAH